MKQVCIFAAAILLVACGKKDAGTPDPAELPPTPHIASSPSPSPSPTVKRIIPVSSMASMTYSNFFSANAIDNDPNTMWISGTDTASGGPQHILFDLAAKYKIAKIRLVPSIDANGLPTISTTQEIGSHPSFDYANRTMIKSRVVAESANRQPIDFEFAPGEFSAQFIDVTTNVCAESWVAFWEIEITYYDY